MSKFRFLLTLILVLAFANYSYAEEKKAVANSSEITAKPFDILNKEKIGELTLGLSGKKLEKKLGKASNKSPFQVWGADGQKHQTWSYTKLGIKLDMIQTSKNDTEINTISIKKPCLFKSIRKIGIGSSREAVMKAYEKEIDRESLAQNKNTIIAGTIYGGIMFDIKNDKVEMIFLGAGAE